MTTEDKVKESLIAQLKAQNKLTDYCVDQVEAYMNFWRLRSSLIQDIDKNGIRLKVQTGNGYQKEIANPSIGDLQKASAAMLSILKSLELETPVLTSDSSDYL